MAILVKRITFDRLILATGGRPRLLDVPVAPDARVHYLRTWADADALRTIAGTIRNVVIAGAGFIGLETAASLRELGLNVTVIGAEERPLEKVLGRDVADFIRRTHESHGVRFRLGRRPAEIRADSVVLDDGSIEACDIVVAGIGVEPDVALAQRAPGSDPTSEFVAASHAPLVVEIAMLSVASATLGSQLIVVDMPGFVHRQVSMPPSAAATSVTASVERWASAHRALGKRVPSASAG